MPIPMAAAMLGSAAISGLGGIMGSSSQADAMKKAMADYRAATEAAIARQEEGLGNASSLLNPYITEGDQARDYYNYLASGGLMGTEFDYEAGPGYDFRKQEMEDAINKRYAQMGILDSGANVGQLAYENQRLSANEFDRSLGQLGSIRDLGYNASNSMAGYETGVAGNIANTGMQGASGVAGMQQGLGNINAGMYTGIADNLSSGLTNYAMSPYMDSILNSMGGTSSYNTGNSNVGGNNGYSLMNGNLGIFS